MKGEPNKIMSNDFRREKPDGNIPLLIPTTKFGREYLSICEMMK